MRTFRSRLRARMLPAPHESERGVALILAIGFLVVVAAITGSLLPAISSGFKGREILDTVRDRQYAADAGIEAAIAATRANFEAGNPACTGIGTQPAVNNVTIRVDCVYSPSLTLGGFLQRNVIYSACVSGGACTAASTIVQAQVNFQSTAGFATAVAPITRTWIQSWSVNQ